MRLHYFQHVPFEGLGNIEKWAQSRGWEISATRFYQNDPLPDIHGFDWLVVMGGPMGVMDEAEFPWLAQEKQLIAQAIRQRKVVLGICLGAQLIASASGARVYRNSHKEIGWMPIELTEAGKSHPLFRNLPGRLEVFHWHGDTFDLPKGAVHLASSAACRHQAFAIDERVLGLQFHLESTPQGIDALIAHCGDELIESPYIQSAAEMRTKVGSCSVINGVMGTVLTNVESAAAA
jgi:GMP synthase (glutamine-hydrolysing)